MNQVDQNIINKDMSDSSLIDLDSLNFSDNQTWLYKSPDDSGTQVDLVDWSLSLDWPVYDDEEYRESESKLYATLDDILKKQYLGLPDKHRFDSRTYVKPKRWSFRPIIQNVHRVREGSPPSLSPNSSLNNSNKYMTYNKYTGSGLGAILRHKTFNVDTDTENSTAVKEYAMKRRSFTQDEPQLDDEHLTLIADVSERLSTEPARTKPINIDLSQPANNLHNTFNKGFNLTDRTSMNMYQSGESLMKMSPPSLVSSILMDGSGNFNFESLDGRRSVSHRDSGLPTSARESIDPMVTSMTLSILDEKDMSTSFLSQTTYPDHDSVMDSLPPSFPASLASSINSSYIVSNTSKPKPDNDSNALFSSATFTHLEQSERLLSARPRHQLYNSINRDSLRNMEIQKSEEAKENTNNYEAKMTVLHFANRQFRTNMDAEKENSNGSFEKDEAFFKEMQKSESGKSSLNLTYKQELNEIIQARQKLSLARKALPSDPEVCLPNQMNCLDKMSTQTVTVSKMGIDNASELLSRRRSNGYVERQPPQRNATFKKTPSPKQAMEETVVLVKDTETKIIDINSATVNLLNSGDKTLQQQEGWGSQERAMVASSESTDTATFSSSSPPDSVPDSNNPRSHVASTPLTLLKKNAKCDLMNLHSTISPIFSPVDDQSFIVIKSPTAHSPFAVDPHNDTKMINTTTLVRKTGQRDFIGSKTNQEQRVVPKIASRVPAPSIQMAAPAVVPRKSGLPTSKLRQYSSHKDLRMTANAPPSHLRAPMMTRPMSKRTVYSSNPTIFPTQPIRRDSYTIATNKEEEKPAAPVLTNPPVLVRQGTETLRRERPVSQLVQSSNCSPPTRLYSIAGTTQFRGNGRPSTVPAQKPQGAVEPAPTPLRTTSAVIGEARMSALPRPSRLPAPKRALRPPSVYYSMAPAADDHY